MIPGPARMLMIFVDESDLYQEMPLYEAILRRILMCNIAGATVNVGIMGYGQHHHLHHKRLFGVSDDRPITITVVDEDSKLRTLIPHIRPLVREGLMLMTDVEVIA